MKSKYYLFITTSLLFSFYPSVNVHKYYMYTVIMRCHSTGVLNQRVACFGGHSTQIVLSRNLDVSFISPHCGPTVEKVILEVTNDNGECCELLVRKRLEKAIIIALFWQVCG